MIAALPSFGLPALAVAALVGLLIASWLSRPVRRAAIRVIVLAGGALFGIMLTGFASGLVLGAPLSLETRGGVLIAAAAMAAGAALSAVLFRRAFVAYGA